MASIAQPARMPLRRGGLLWVGVVVVIAVLAAGLWFLFQPSGTTASSLLPVGTAAPAFHLADSTGHPVTLGQYRGHPTILNFWATFCAPCRTETPLLERTALAHTAQGLVILGIDQGEPQDAISSFGKEYGLTYPLLGDYGLSVNKQYGVTALPTTYFLDAHGIVRATSNSMLTLDSLAAGLRSIGLDGTVPTPQQTTP